MKRLITSLVLAAAAVAALSSCQEKLIEKSPVTKAKHSVSFVAGLDEVTKTTMEIDDNVASFSWAESDKANIYVYENDVECHVDEDDATIEEGKLSFTAEFEESESPYSYKAVIASEFESNAPKVKASQSISGSSYCSDADILVARPILNQTTIPETFSLKYTRPIAISKMTLKNLEEGEEFKSLTVTSDKAIVKTLTLNNSTETPYTWSTDGTNTITITPKEDLATPIVADADGNMVISFITAPVDAATLTVCVVTNKNKYEKSFTKTIDFNPGSVKSYGVDLSTATKKKLGWVAKSISNIENGETVVIVSSKTVESTTSNYAMSNDNGTSSAPTAVAVTVDNGVITSAVADNCKWIFQNVEGGFSFYKYNDSANYLYCTNNNNGVRVGNTNANKVFSIINNYIFNNGQSRYLGVYDNADWRCYNSTEGNIAGQTFTFYVFDDGKIPLAKPVITLTTDKDNKKVDVSWDAVPNATKYIVSCTSKDPIETTETTASFTELLDNVKYTVIVKAVGDKIYRDSEASETFEFKSVLTTMDAIFAKATEVSSTATEVTIQFNNWVISGSGVSGNNAYLTDGTKGLIIYASGHGFKKGDILSGTVTCKLQLYNNASEITDLNSKTTGLTVSTGGVVEPYETTISELSGINTGAYISLIKLSCSGTGSTPGTYNLSDNDGKTIVANKTIISTLPSMTIGVKYNVKGVYFQYGDNKQVAPREDADISETPAEQYDITIDPTIQNGSVTTDPANKAAEGVEVTLTATPNTGYKFKSWSVTKTASSEEITVTNNKFTMPAEAVTVSATFEEGTTTNTYSHIFSTKPATGDNNSLSSVSWNISATNLNNYQSGYAGVQFGTSNKLGDISLTSSSAWNYNTTSKVKEIRIWLNTGGGTVSPTVSVGGTSITSDGVTVIKNSSCDGDYKNATKVTFKPTSALTGVVVISVSKTPANAGAGYICAIEIDSE